MIDRDILYLKKKNRSTEIYYKDGFQTVLEHTLERVLDMYCLQDLTTLEGRIKAIQKVYHIKKQIPIYLSEELILIQTTNKKEIDNIYINSCNIIDIIKDKQNTKIIFCDSSELIVNKPIHLIEKYIQKSFQIKKSNQIISEKGNRK